MREKEKTKAKENVNGLAGKYALSVILERAKLSELDERLEGLRGERDLVFQRKAAGDLGADSDLSRVRLRVLEIEREREDLTEYLARVEALLRAASEDEILSLQAEKMNLERAIASERERVFEGVVPTLASVLVEVASVLKPDDGRLGSLFTKGLCSEAWGYILNNVLREHENLLFENIKRLLDGRTWEDLYAFGEQEHERKRLDTSINLGPVAVLDAAMEAAKEGVKV